MTGQARDRLGRFGIWRSAGQVTPELAVGLEQLGFGALWLGSSPDGDLVQAERLLDATTTLILATSIVNIWKDPAAKVATSFARVTEFCLPTWACIPGPEDQDCTIIAQTPTSASASPTVLALQP